MARKYAQDTSVPLERSLGEIESLLSQHGTTHFATLKAPDSIKLAFVKGGLSVRISVPMPTGKMYEYKEPKNTWDKPTISKDQVDRNVQQETNRRFRALVLVIKSKLVGIADGIVTFEDEFLPYVVDPSSGQTIGERLRPQLPMIAAGKSVPLLMAE